MNLNLNQRNVRQAIPNNNNMNQDNNALLNNYIDYSSINPKNLSNKRKINSNNSQNTNFFDERLQLSLNCLGLKKYIINFQKNGINFDDFLSLNNKDFSRLKIPNNIIEIIQNFIISYLNFGSLYTTEEIIRFFQFRKQKMMNEKSNSNTRMNRGSMGKNMQKNQIINNNRNMMINNNSNNMNQNNSRHRNNLNNSNNRNNAHRPKSQSNKPINYDYYFNNNQNNINQYNYGIINEQNKNAFKKNVPNFPNNKVNNNVGVNKNNINQIRNNNNKNLINNKNILNNINNSNSNTNIDVTSLYSSTNNLNYISPSVDNFSHIAIKENYSNIDNIIKMNQFREMNNDNYNNLKRNLSNEYNINKNKNSNKIMNNINNKNKSIRNQNKKQSHKNNIIEQMDNVIKKIQTRKENNLMTQSNIGNINQDRSLSSNMNKGYHSDGYLNEQKKLQEFNNLINNNKIAKNHNNNSYKNLKPNNYLYNNYNQNSDKNSYNNSNKNNMNLNGYEINTYYTGDTSQLDSMRGYNNMTPDIKKIRGKNGKIYYSKANKIKKINEEQTRKIEQLLAYNSSSVMNKTPINTNNIFYNSRGNSFKKNKGVIMNNYDNFNFNEDEINSLSNNNNNSKTNLTSYTYSKNNNYIKPFNYMNYQNMNQNLFPTKNNKNNNKMINELYSPFENRFIKQKQLISQGRIIQKKPQNNNFNNARIYNNTNNYVNNRGNIVSNICDTNDIFEDNQENIFNINKNRNSFNNKNQGKRKNNGPVQIQIQNKRNINSNMNNINNLNNNIKRNNYINNNSNNNFINKNSNNNIRNNNFIHNNSKNRKNNNSKNLSVDQKKINNNFKVPYNYMNDYINMNNIYDNPRRNAKSFDINREHLNIGVYPGIHNINNNINNININNINYDSTGYNKDINKIMGLDFGINYKTQKNFYQQNNIIDDEVYFDEII